MALAAGVLALAVAGWFLGEPLLNALRGRHVAPSGPKQWVLVADFDSTPKDQAVERAARSLVETALGQSNVAAPVSREQVALGLEHAGKPDTTRVTTELARELAYRSSIKVVVAGDIQRIGDAYAITMRAVDADSGRTMLSISDRAARSAEFIPCMNRLGNRLRSALGERSSSIAATRPLYAIQTPSFEAYREIVAAQEELRRGFDQEVVAHMRRALALDPDCPVAWAFLGSNALDRGEADSAAIFTTVALSKPQRLSAFDRLQLQSQLAVARGDLNAALASVDRILAADSSSVEGWASRAYVLAWLGRPREAAACSERCEALSPLGPHPIGLLNHASALVAAGDATGARAVMRRLPAHVALEHSPIVPLVDERWAEAESLVNHIRSAAGQAHEEKRYVRVRACAAGARGRLAEADGILASLETATTAEPGRPYVVLYRSFLASMRGKPPAALPSFILRGTNAMAILIQGLHALQIRDLPLARRKWAQFRARPAAEREALGRLPNLFEAERALAEGRAGGALGTLLEPARIAFEKDTPPDNMATQVEMRLVVAEAFEQEGRRDSAASYYAFALEQGGTGAWNWLFIRALLHPLMLQRLVMTELSAGQVENARRDFDHLVKSCDQPDAEMSRLIADARSTLQAAENASRSARR